MSSFVLPRFVSISVVPARGANDVDEYGDVRFTYGRYVTEEGDAHGKIRCSLEDGDEDSILSPFAKYEVVKARTQIQGQVSIHLRNCYSGKFLRRTAQDNMRMVAAADAPEEDVSKWSSTIITLESNNSLPLIEGMRQFMLHSRATGFSHQTRISVITDSTRVLSSGFPPQMACSFCFHSLETLVSVPRYIAFMADNGRYARSGFIIRISNSSTSMTVVPSGIGFDMEEGVEDPLEYRQTHFDVLQARNGSIRIKSVDTNMFLQIGVNRWITASAAESLLTDPFHRRNLAFLPLKLEEAGKAFITLQHVATRNYLRRFSEALVSNGLEAGGQQITKEARFQVQELVRSREVYNVAFRGADTIIHEPSPISIVTKDVANYSSVSTQTAELSFRYAQFESKTYSGSHSWRVGLNYTSSVRARLPVLKFIGAEVTIELDASYEGSYEWESTKEETSELETKFVVSVTPETRSKVGMVVSRATVDVPFSYTQTDTLYDWSYNTVRKHDGLFHGESTYVNFDVADEKAGQQGPP